MTKEQSEVVGVTTAWDTSSNVVPLDWDTDRAGLWPVERTTAQVGGLDTNQAILPWGWDANREGVWPLPEEGGAQLDLAHPTPGRLADAVRNDV